MMNQHVKELILAALESSDYKQTSCALKKGDCFCIEGLFCEIYRQDTGNGKWVPTDGIPDRESFEICEGNDWSSMMPVVVSEWAGIDKVASLDVSRLHLPITKATLLSLNDGYSITFGQFAQLIKEQW